MAKIKTTFKGISFLLILLVFIPAVRAEFTVDPSYAKITGVKPGSTIKLKNVLLLNKYLIGVKNLGKEKAKYRLVAVSCKEYGIAPHPGYEDITDISWINIKKPVFEVESGKLYKVDNVYFSAPLLKISGQKEKRYQAIIKIINEPLGNQSMNIEAVLPLWIEMSNK